MQGANAHKLNTYSHQHFDKIASNDLEVYNGALLTLDNGFMRITQPWEYVEWVSVTSDRFASDNETQEQRVVNYRPIFWQNTYKMWTLAGQVLTDNLVGKFFNIGIWADWLQYIDVATCSSTTGQLRVESIIDGDKTVWEIRLVPTTWYAAPVIDVAASLVKYENTASWLDVVEPQVTQNTTDIATNATNIATNATDIAALQAIDPLVDMTAIADGARLTSNGGTTYDLTFNEIDTTTANPKLEILVWWAVVKTVQLNRNDIQIDNAGSDFDLTDDIIRFNETNGDSSGNISFAKYNVSVAANPAGWVNIMQNGNLLVTVNRAGWVEYDNTASGLTATDVQGAIDELVTAVGGIAGWAHDPASVAWGSNPALSKWAGTSQVFNLDLTEAGSYDNTTSWLTADNIQEAIDEVQANIPTVSAPHDPVSIKAGATPSNPALKKGAGASQELELDLTEAGSYDNTASWLTADDIQGAIDELAGVKPDPTQDITDADLATAGQPVVADITTYITANWPFKAGTVIRYIGDGSAVSPDASYEVTENGTAIEQDKEFEPTIADVLESVTTQDAIDEVSKTAMSRRRHFLFS